MKAGQEIIKSGQLAGQTGQLQPGQRLARAQVSLRDDCPVVPPDTTGTNRDNLLGQLFPSVKQSRKCGSSENFPAPVSSDCGSEESLQEVDQAIDWVMVGWDCIRAAACFFCGWSAALWWYA